MGDATQLFQVTMNLCTNAVQAMGDEGRIGIRLERVEQAGPVAKLQGDLAAGAYVRLDIDDTGPGIPPDVLARIFDPFFTTKKGGEGTGLGLSVVHGIVSGLGGAIDVAPLAPTGTRVSVWLPVSGELAPQAAASAAESPTGNGEVVMVVDDEEALVQLAEEKLAELGYEPVGFSSAEAALAAFEANPARFDALLTDHMLPAMPGSELARRVLAIRPGLPVILMSGNLGERAESEAREAGVRATLHKPLGLQELAEQLAALFA
jgi:CheY-like chemotaxis protein